MFRLVKQLQKKPHHVRKNVALGTSVVTTLLIAGMWVSVSDFSRTESVTGTIVIEDQRPENQAASPLEALGDDFSRVKEGFQSLVGYTKEEEGIEVVDDPEPVVKSDIESSAAEVDYSFE